MALQALGPATRPGLGFSVSGILGTAAAVPSPIQPVAAGAAGVESIISGLTSLFGGASRFNSAPYEGAQTSIINTYLLGIAHGSVKAGQFLLAANQYDTSAFSKTYDGQALSEAQQAWPLVMQQAAQAGAMKDTQDGYGGLLILSQLNVGYTNQWAGYNNNTGAPPSGATLQLVQQLAQLPGASGTPASVSPTNIGSAGTGGVAGISTASMPMLIGAGILVALFVATRPKGRRS